MKTIELSVFDAAQAEEALRAVPEKDDVCWDRGSFYWVGSVDAQNSQQFIDLGEHGQLEKMGDFAEITQDIVYGLLARRKSGRSHRLFVLRMKPNPHNPQRCVFTKVFDDIVMNMYTPTKAAMVPPLFTLAQLLGYEPSERSPTSD